MSAIGNASEAGCTHKVSREYSAATTTLKWVHSLPIYCAFSQLLVCITEFIWRWEMHRNQSTEPFFLDLQKLKLATGYNIYSQETDTAFHTCCY